jgi:LuxR family maltose regulon positive regulatory protein
VPALGARFGSVWRERVVRRIAAAAELRVVGIVAPAGFGKTTALRQYLERRPDALVYDPSPEATALAPFARGFAETVAAIDPAIRANVSTALQTLHGSPAFAADLAQWFASHLRDRRVTLVVDDFHVGDADPAIAVFMRRLVDTTAGEVRFIISSRTSSGLPFASWTAYGLCDLPIGADELRLSPDEALEWAGPRADRAVVAELLARVDGWPAAFQLALKTAASARDLAGAGESSREMLYEYLADQVWRALDPASRAFLRTVAFLPRLTIELCAAAGYDGALALIENLRERVTFVTKRSEDEYALHELFRDFVRREVRRDGETALADAWKTAARALRAVDRLDEALEALLRARDGRAVADVLVAHGLAFADRGRLAVVERALAVAESDDGAASAVLPALHGICAEAHGLVSEAEHHFRSALATVETLDSALAVDVITKIAVHYARYDRRDALSVIGALQRRTGLTDRQRAMLLDVEAVALTFTDRLTDAMPVIERALALVERPSVDTDARSIVHANAALIFYHARDEHAMRRYAASAIEGAEWCENQRRAAAVWMNLYLMHAGAGRAAEAARCAAKCVDAARRAGDFEYLGIGLRAQLKIAAERGDDAEIDRLRQALVGVPSTSRCGMIYEIVALALVHPSAGRWDDAQEILRRLPESDLVAVQNRTRYALLAAVCAAAGAPAEAEAALERHHAFRSADQGNRAIFERTNALSDRWEVIARSTLQGADAGRSAAADALPLPRDLAGIDVAIHAAWAHDAARFRRALADLDRADRSGFARFVGAVCAAPFAHGASARASAVPLTPTERRILGCLAEGLSNQAIADRHRRSVNTVRTQVAALLAKLGASSRGEAVAIASRCGLLDTAD